MAEGSALKAMVSFFTIWEQDITEDDMAAMERKFHLAPVAGSLMGLAVLVVSLVLLLLSWNGILSSSLIDAALVLAVVYVGSRFLHVDGLADFGDGMVVAGGREDHVRALKDTLVGAGGVGVAVVVIILAFAEYSYAADLVLLAVLAPAAEVMVKNAQVSAAAFGQPGNGMASRQVSETSTVSAWVATAVSLVLSVVFCAVGVLLVNAITDSRWFEVDMAAALVAVVLGVVVSLLVGYLMARRSNSVFGMVNGDVLGATNEISRVAVMLVMLLVYTLVV